METQDHLITAKDLGYITDMEFDKVKLISYEGYKLVCGLLRKTKENYKD